MLCAFVATLLGGDGIFALQFAGNAAGKTCGSSDHALQRCGGCHPASPELKVGMQQGIAAITLGVESLARSRRFYEAAGCPSSRMTRSSSIR